MSAGPDDDGTEPDAPADDGGAEPGDPGDGGGLGFEQGIDLGNENLGLLQPMAFGSPEPGDIIGEDGTVLHEGEIDITTNAFVANYPVMIANIIIIDQGTGVFTPPENLGGGQIWTYKDVQPIECQPGHFEVTFHVYGKQFITEDIDGNPATATSKNPLQEGTFLTIGDVLGAKFVYGGYISSSYTDPIFFQDSSVGDWADYDSTYPGFSDDFSYWQSYDVVWRIPASYFDDSQVDAEGVASYSVTFAIHLDDPESLEGIYPTNEDTLVEFVPAHGESVLPGELPKYNTFYYGVNQPEAFNSLNAAKKITGNGVTEFYINRYFFTNPTGSVAGNNGVNIIIGSGSQAYADPNGIYTYLATGYYSYDAVNGLRVSSTQTAACPHKYYFYNNATNTPGAHPGLIVFEDFYDTGISLEIYIPELGTSTDILPNVLWTAKAGTATPDKLRFTWRGDNRTVYHHINNPGKSRVLHPVTLYKFDKNTLAPLPGAKFMLEKRNTNDALGEDENGNPIDPASRVPWPSAGNNLFTTGDDGRIVFPYLEPGSYRLTEVEPPDGYLESLEYITFWVEDGKPGTLFPESPRIGDLSPRDVGAFVTYDKYTGLFVFVENETIPNDSFLRTFKNLPEQHVYANAHGTAKFLFQMEKFRPAEENEDADILISTWVGDVIVRQGLVDPNEDRIKPVAFGGSNTLMPLEYGYIYKITELDVMRYGLTGVRLQFEDEDGPVELGDLTGPAIWIDMTDPSRKTITIKDSGVFEKEYTLPRPDPDDPLYTGEFRLFFDNERQNDNYLSNSDLKRNTFTLPTPTPIPAPTPSDEGSGQ